MESSDAPRQAVYASPSLGVSPTAARPALPWTAALPLVHAGVASTLHRVRRGEGALLAVNLSLIAHQGSSVAQGTAQALVSVLAIGLMYALNDLYDAPTDWNNPKKDRGIISAYLEHRAAGYVAVFGLKVATLALAFWTLGSPATFFVAAVMLANLVYSTLLKGVPVVDVAWCGVWGGLYACIVGAPWSLFVLVVLMTAVCHLYQALGDRGADAANGITTTAVRSPRLSAAVLLVLSVLLFAALRGPLGAGLALTAFTPLALFFVVSDPRAGWLLIKVYFGVVWLFLLGSTRAIG